MPLLWADMAAWSELTNAGPRPWEWNAIAQLDDTWMRDAMDRIANDGKPMAPATAKGLRDGFRSLGARQRKKPANG